MSFNWPVGNGAGSRRILETRQRMIEDTNAFIKWALENPDQVPQIPRRRADVGGYESMLKQPGARAAVNYWWYKMLRKTML